MFWKNKKCCSSRFHKQFEHNFIIFRFKEFSFQLFFAGLWETNLNTSLLMEQANEMFANTSFSQNFHNYSDKIPIMESSRGSCSNTLNMDDETSSEDFVKNNNLNRSLASGYPADYGLPMVPGAEINSHLNKFNSMTSEYSSSPVNNLPMNAKTLRVWQKGGVPVLPPVTTALKLPLRSFNNNRNSPDEGYVGGSCEGGTDV